MSTFTKKLLSMVLAMVMILGNVAPAAAANYGSMFPEDENTVRQSDNGDLFGGPTAFSVERTAAASDHAELPKAPMKESAHASSQEPATGGNSYGDGPAEWAFDGDVGKPWHSKYTGGQVEGPHTLEWNLGTEGQVFEVSKLHYHMKGNGNSGNGLWQKVTVQVFNGTEQTLTQDFDVANGNCDLVFTQTVQGTKMKVTVTQGAGGYACAGELDVYGKLIAGEPTPPPAPATEVGPVALAEGKEYKLIPQTEIQNPTAKSQHDNTANPHSGDGPAAWAFDGLNDSAWHCHYTNGALPQWIRWELGGTRTVGQIGYIRRNNSGNNTGNGRWKDIEVIGILPDGSEKVLTSGLIKESRMNGDGTEVMIGFEPTEVTALKVNITDSYNSNGKYAHAGEIKTYEVVDKVAPPPPVTHNYRVVVEPAELTLNEGESAVITASVTDNGVVNPDLTPKWEYITDGKDDGCLRYEILPNNQVRVTATGASKYTKSVRASYTHKIEGGTSSTNASCSITINPVETLTTIALNGVDYQVHSLQEAVEQSGLIGPTQNGYTPVRLESIVYKTGVIRPADFEYMSAHKDYFNWELKTYRIEDAVEPRGLPDAMLPQNAFNLRGSDTVGLQNVYLGRNIKGIGCGAFHRGEEIVSFEAPGVEKLYPYGEMPLENLYSLEVLDLPALKEVPRDRIGFGKSTRNTKAWLKVTGATVIDESAFAGYRLNPTDLFLGAVPPALNPASATEFNLFGNHQELLLHVPDSAIDTYKADSRYNAETGKWAGLILVEPEVPVPQCEVKLTETTLNMTRGDSGHELFAEFQVDGVKVPDAYITWTVDSQNVEIHPGSGERIYVKALAPCEGAVITASVTHEGKTYTADCVVNIANAYEVVFNDDGIRYLKYVAPDTALGDNLQADQPSTATKIFDGWYNGDTKATRDTVITGDITFEARYEILNTVEVVTADGTVTGYESFNMAVENAPDGATLRLIRDIYMGVAPEPYMDNHVSNNRTLTVDLNGHGLIGRDVEHFQYDTATPIIVDEGSTLTVKDSVGGGRIVGCQVLEYGVSDKPHYGIWNKGTLTVESGTIIGVESKDNRRAEFVIAVLNHNIATINGGELYGFVANSIAADCRGYALWTAGRNGEKATVNGGKLVGAKLNTADPSDSIAIGTSRDAMMSITGGEFYGTKRDIDTRYTSCVKGGYFAHNFAEGANDPALLVSGYEAQRGNLVDGQWTADEAGTLYRVAKPVEMITVTFQGEGLATTTRQVEKGQKLGALPEDPVKEGFNFLGWFNGEEQITADTVVNNAFTATAKFEAEAVEAVLTAKVNGTQYGGADLAAIIAAAGGNDAVTTLEMISGTVTQADMDQFKLLANMTDLTMNLDGDLTVLNKAGEPTTVLGGNDAHVVFAYAGPNNSRAKLAHLTLQGFTALNQNGIKQYFDSNHSGYTRDSGLISVDLPDVVSIGFLGLTGHKWLETLNVPKLETIGNSGLKGNTSLNNLELPAIKTIDMMGLQNNNKLTNIHMGPNVTNLNQIGLGKTDGNGKKSIHLVLDAVTPPTVNNGGWQGTPCFEGANYGSTVKVPAEALSAYLGNADLSKVAPTSVWNGLKVVSDGYDILTFTVPQQSWDTKYSYIAKGAEVLETQIPTAKKNGMTFLEWNTKRGGDGETFTAGKTITGDLEVFAQFEAAQFTVTFKAGDTVVETKTVTGGSALGDLPAAPDKEGYTFTGWYDESNIVVSSQTTVGKDMTIVAKYRAKQYNVKFMNEGALVNERTVEHGQTLGTVPADPSEGTRTFKGWFSGEIQANADTVITSNMTFQAVYGPEAMTGRDVNFYAYVDGAPKLVENRTGLTVYKIGSRQGIPAALLEEVYGAYGFTADQLTDGSKLFANTTRDGGTIWADAPAEVVEGVGYALTVNQDSVTEIDVYYLPKQSVTGSSAKDNANTMAAETFYTITNDQNSDKAYVLNGEAIGSKLPAAPTKEGATFVEWTVNDQAVNAETVVNAPMALVAKWQADGPEALANRNVKFYAFVDGQRVLAANPTDVTVYWIEGRQCIAGADLEAAYGKYGFKADTLANSNGMFLHTDRNNTGIWNAGIKTVSGVPYAATINHKGDTVNGAKGNEIDVYYLPKTSGDVGNYNDAIAAQTFYSVTNGDNVQYFLNGTEAVVKVSNVNGKKWIATGTDDTVIEGVKGDTETTITIPAIAQPYTLSQQDVVEIINITVKISDVEYSGENLESALNKCSLGAYNLNNLEFVSGKLTQEDLAYLTTSSKVTGIKTLTLNISDTMQVIGKDGQPTTVLNADTAINLKKSGSSKLTTLTLGGFTEIQPGGIGSNHKFGLKTLNLPDVITVDDRALNGWTGLQTLNIPKAETLGVAALGGCSNLSTLTMNSMKVMKTNALINTEKLMTLRIPATIETIEDVNYGQGKAQGAQIIIEKQTPPTIDPVAFNGISSGIKQSQQATLTVPAGAFEAYVLAGTPEADVSGLLTSTQAMYGDRKGNPYLREEGSFVLQFHTNESWNTVFAYSKAGAPLTAKQIPTDTKSGKILVGWNTNMSGTGKRVTEGFVPTYDADVYPIFADAVTVTVDAANGTEPTTIQVEKGKAIGDKMPENPVKEGYTFVKWLDAEGSEVTAETVVNAPITMTAQWQKNIQAVKFYPYAPKGAGGGMFVGKSYIGAGSYIGWQTQAEGLVLKAQPAEGYKFVKWVAADELNAEGTEISTELELTLTPNHNNKVLTPVFEKLMPRIAITQNVPETARLGEAAKVSFTVANSGEGAFEGVINIRFQGTNTDRTLTLTFADTVEAVEARNEKEFLGYDVTVSVPAGETVTVEATATAAAVRAYQFKTLTDTETSSTATLNVTADGVCMIQETGEYFATVSEGVQAAKPGQTVVLVQDAAEELVMLTENITLDLNGRQLTVHSLVAFKDNHVVDNGAAKGKLIMTSGNIVLDETNRQFPVYLDGGYVFGEMIMQQTNAEKQKDGSYVMVLKPLFGGEDASHAEFGDGVADNRFQICARLSWTRTDGTQAYQDFIYTDELIARVYGKKMALKLTISGVEGLQGLTIRSYVKSDTGAHCFAENGFQQTAK